MPVEAMDVALWALVICAEMAFHRRNMKRAAMFYALAVAALVVGIFT